MSVESIRSTVAATNISTMYRSPCASTDVFFITELYDKALQKYELVIIVNINICLVKHDNNAGKKLYLNVLTKFGLYFCIRRFTRCVYGY